MSRAHELRLTPGAGGTILLENPRPLPAHAARIGDWLDHWATHAPDRVFLAERSGDAWREITYRTAAQAVAGYAAGLLARGAEPGRPLLIITGNGVDHGLIALAAQRIGTPVVPVAEQYAALSAAHSQLEHVLELTNPGIVFAADAAPVTAALTLPAMAGRDVIVGRNGPTGTTALDALFGPGDGSSAWGQVTPDTVAKILMTSGSTSAPKGVLSTHRMLTANQAQVADAFPFVTARPPVLVDWLPWNHTFGGSHNFNLVLANGGTLWIDDGKPLPGLIERSIENLKARSGTIAFNVPAGFARIRDALRDDAGFRARFFADLDMIFYAGASLPQDIWADLAAMAQAERGAPVLTTSTWGLTETAPAAMAQTEPAQSAGRIGVPVAGCTVKLIPADTGYEVRVKGPNITPGYHRDPERTADAFDADGFFITGDAMDFADPDRPEAGMRFLGRLSEDFKLGTGTFVRAAALRLSLLGALAPLAMDVILTGEGREELGVLIFPTAAAGMTLGGTGFAADPALLEDLRGRIAALGGTGSAGRIACAAVLAEPPSMPAGEITAKGSINFARVRQRRAALVDALHAREPGVINL